MYEALCSQHGKGVPRVVRVLDGAAYGMNHHSCGCRFRMILYADCLEPPLTNSHILRLLMWCFVCVLN